MTPLSPQPRLPRTQRGTALIVTVFFLALLTLMVVAFFESATFDRSSAGGHLDRTKAGLFAREGMERVIGTLQRETVDAPRLPTETDDAYARRKRNWILQPGALIVPLRPPDDLGPMTPPVDQKRLHNVVDLSSGAPTKAPGGYTDPVFVAPDLNAPVIAERLVTTRLITDREDPATGQPVALRLKWVYVRQHSTTGVRQLDYSEEPNLTDAVNPIVGRFAYWTDDESSKINYNLAWKRGSELSKTPNNNPASHPSRINLMALFQPNGDRLTEGMADALHQWTVGTPGRFFNTFADARQLEADVANKGLSDVLAYNKFELTHYNHDPDTTFFGEERIMLTTNRNLVPKNADGSYARKFIDIMRDEDDLKKYGVTDPDPGELDHIAGGQRDFLKNATGSSIVANKFDAVVRDLLRYISEDNWPLTPHNAPPSNRSFKDKYYPGTTATEARLAQIVVNIIDYVRAKESKMKVIAPLRFAYNGTQKKYTLHPDDAYAAANAALGISGNSYQGVSRSPYLTELGMWIEKDPAPVPNPKPANWPSTPLYRCYFKAEIYLPRYYGLDEGIDLVPDLSAVPGPGSMGWLLTHSAAASGTVIHYFPTPGGALKSMATFNDAVRIFRGDVEFGKGTNGTVLMPGERVVVTKMYYRDRPYGSAANTKTINIRTALINATSGANGLLEVLGRWPRVAICPQSTGKNYTISNPATTTMDRMLTVETDDPRANSHPDDWMTNVNGGNTLGAVNSRSSLGNDPLGTVQPQQDTDEDGKITDASLYMPQPKGVGRNDDSHDGGRVASVGELGYVSTGNDAQDGSTPWRTLRLQPNNYADATTLPDWALLDLFTVPNSSNGTLDSMMKPHDTSIGGRLNVNSHVQPFDHVSRDRGLVALVAGSSADPAAVEAIAANIYNRVPATGGKIYGYPWRPSSTENVYDTTGEICEIKGVADGGEASEALVREIGSLITTRGGVFSVYTVGQSLKQTRSGGLKVTAEQRYHAVVERYLNNRGTAVASDDEVQFRTIYFRNLTP